MYLPPPLSWGKFSQSKGLAWPMGQLLEPRWLARAWIIPVCFYRFGQGGRPFKYVGAVKRWQRPSFVVGRVRAENINEGPRNEGWQHSVGRFCDLKPLWSIKIIEPGSCLIMGKLLSLWQCHFGGCKCCKKRPVCHSFQKVKKRENHFDVFWEFVSKLSQKQRGKSLSKRIRNLHAVKLDEKKPLTTPAPQKNPNPQPTSPISMKSGLWRVPFSPLCQRCLWFCCFFWKRGGKKCSLTPVISWVSNQYSSSAYLKVVVIPPP